MRGDAPNPALQLDGVVSEDGREGLFRALEPAELDGRVLGELGLTAPLLRPDELILVRLVASSSDVHL